MTDLTALSRTELDDLSSAIRREINRRLTTCQNCGGHAPLYMLHACTPGGGINLPLDSAEAKALIRA